MNRVTMVAVLAWLLLVGACGWIIARAEFNADLQAFLPQAPTPAQQVLVDQLRDGMVSRLILVAIEGDDPDALARLSRALVQRLTNDTAFTSVNNGAEDLFQSDSTFLIENRYLLSPAIRDGHFTEAGLRTALESQLELLASPMGALTGRMLPRDPTGEFLAIIERLESRTRPQLYDGVWFSADGSRALLIAQTAAPGFEIDAQQLALASMKAAFEEARNTLAISDASLTAVGPGVFAVTTRDAIKSDAIRVTGAAMVAISVLLLFVLRSARALVLMLMPVISGALAGVAVVAIAFGSVHGITIGFGATLIGESVDYAIHLLTGAGRGTRSETTLARIWPTLRLGVLTSIAGSAALLLSGFPGLAQLGLFSIAGLIVALGVTRWIVPHLLPTEFRVAVVDSWGPGLLRWVGYARLARFPSILLILACIAWLTINGGAAWNDDLESLSPVPEQLQSLDGEIRRELGAPDVRKLVVVRGVDQEAALQVSESVSRAFDSLAEQGAIAGYDSPTLYLPSQAAQRARQQAIPDMQTLRARFSRAVANMPFKSGTFSSFFEDAQLARNAAPLIRSDLGATTLATQVDALLVQRRGTWFAMLPLLDVADAALVEDALANFDPREVMLIDLKNETDALYYGYRTRILTFSIIGAVAIVLLLLAVLRSFRRCFQVVMPIAAAIVVTIAILAASGVQLTMFHLVAMLLVVGVGSNYTLFFDRTVQQVVERERTFVALATCNLSTVLGFGLIGLASTPVLSAIGVTVAIGAALSLLFGAVFMRRDAGS